MDILNLGCGNRLVEGAVHHDRTKHRDEISVVHDLNILPWPFEDESFDRIDAWAVFEHLDHDLFTSLAECWRILRPDGVLRVKLPLWNKEVSWRDPSHRWFYTLQSLDYFDPDTETGREYEFYTPYKWKLLKVAPIKGSGSFQARMQVRK